MRIKIENDFCLAYVETHGAELVSFMRKDDRKEIIWQSDEAIWKGQAPVLFPVIGRLKDSEYLYEGNIYRMPKHGFARSSEFEVTESSENSITLLLTSGKETNVVYPFSFRFEICYSLNGYELTKMHTISNLSKSEMYYELGGHEGYNLCYEPSETMEDYYIEFQGEKQILPLKLNQEIQLTRDTYEIPLEDGRLPLHMDLFKEDALILHRYPQKKIAIKSRKSKHSIVLEFPDFETIGIWTMYLENRNTNYVCLEPWSSLPECSYVDKQLKNKIDIRKLNSLEQESLCYKINISETK